MTAEDAAKQCLAPSIQSVADQYPDSKVVLIAHSMGGLVSRAYIEDPSLYRNNVERLITLGTPHTGVNIQTLLKLMLLVRPDTAFASVLYCQIDPGTCQLGSDQALLFDISHRPNRNVPYNFIAGLGGPLWTAFFNPTEGANDGIVGYYSALGYQYLPSWVTRQPFDTAVEVVPIPQQSRGYTGAAHVDFFGTSYFDHPKSLSCVSRYLNITGQPQDCPASPSANLNQSSLQLPTSYTPTSSGTLQTGDILTTTLDLDGSATDVLLGWSRGGLRMTLTAPDGTLVTSTNVAQLFPGGLYQGPTNGLDQPIAAYHLPSPSVGRWTATIAATDVVTETTYTLFGALHSPLQLNLSAPASVSGGQLFQVTATISDATTLADGATVVASLPLESGVQQVTLSRTAPGVYARQVDQMITVRASGVQRQGNATVTLIDRNKNGRYEALQVSANYAVTAAGDYAALATLQDSSGHAIALARTTATWATGAQTLSFTFDGGEIVAAGVNGPYRVVVQIVAANGLQLVADEQPLIDGLNYQAANFESQSWVYLPLIRR
jgi:hypothetical protein